MQPLLNQLNSRDPAIRDAALRTARVLPPDDLLQFVLLAYRILSTRKKEANYIFFIVLVLLHLCITISFQRMTFAKQMLGLLKYAIAITCRETYQAKYNRARRLLLQLMQEVDDVRFIASILRFNAENYDRETSTNLRAALKRLLPQVRADHAPQWSKEDKAALLLPLKNPTNDWELTLCCLKALEQVGDASAIPAVKKLADLAYRDNLQKTWRATQDCLLYLEYNTIEFEQAETLLRASDTTTTRPDILLRPAQPAPDTTPNEQLLRPGE